MALVVPKNQEPKLDRGLLEYHVVRENSELSSSVAFGDEVKTLRIGNDPLYCRLKISKEPISKRRSPFAIVVADCSVNVSLEKPMVDDLHRL